MINGILNIFLNTGWKNESCLYYKGNVYWCEGYHKPEDQQYPYHFFVRRFAGRLHKEKTMLNTSWTPLAMS